MPFNYLEGLDNEPVPANIQGNILRGHSRLRDVLCFIRFTKPVADNQQWLQNTVVAANAPFRVTSAAAQAVQAERRVNFLLTYSGLVKLGYPEDRAGRLDAAFVRGSRDQTTLDKLNDREVATWHEKYKDAWDALVHVACNPGDEQRVRELLMEHLAGMQWHLEFGNALDSTGAPLEAQPADGKRFEPFGYREGLSQHYFSEAHAEEDRVPAEPTFEPRRPMSVVLAPDPLSSASHGSYFVFRKLKQDVPKFKNRVNELAVDLTEGKGRFLFELNQFKDERSRKNGRLRVDNNFDKFDPEGQIPAQQELVEFVKANVMGRTSAGSVPPQGGFRENHDIDFSNDRGGGHCPFYAHIRKMQPRGTTGDIAAEVRTTIVRRGLPYGNAQAVAQADQAAPRETGVLFLCAQSNISQQFEVLQQQWANDEAHNFDHEPTPGYDNVVAKPKKRTDPLEEQLDKDLKYDRYGRYVKTIDADFRMFQFVELQGAEYLFAPSLPGLQALAEGGVQ